MRSITLLACSTLISLSAIACTTNGPTPDQVQDKIGALGPAYTRDAERADRVLVGRVLSTTAVPENDARGSRIVTIHEIEVLQTLKGDLPATIQVVTLGGTIGDEGMRVTHQANIQVGQEAIFFVLDRKDGKWMPLHERAVVEITDGSSAEPGLGTFEAQVGTLPAKWPAKKGQVFTINYTVNTANSDLENNLTLDELYRGRNTWWTDTAILVQAKRTDSNTATTISRDGKNQIIFSYDTSLYSPTTIAVTTSYWRGTTMQEFDMVFNEHDNWFFSQGHGDCDPSLNAYYLRTVATHEFGHVFGLADDYSDTNATMYGFSTVCGTDQSSLSQADIDAIEALYPN